MSEATETTTKPARTGPSGPDATAWNIRRYKGTLAALTVVVAVVTVLAFEVLSPQFGAMGAGIAILLGGLIVAGLFQMSAGRGPPAPGTWESSAIDPGAPLARYCAHCAAPNAIGSSYCSNCGDKL